LFFALSLLPFAGIIGFALYRKHHLRLNADATTVKSRRATKMARKRLELANKFLKSGDLKSFYDETGKAIWGYLSAKLKIPFAALTKETAAENLKMKQVSESTTNDLIALLDYCEYARFARMDGGKSPDQIYSEVIALLTKVENEIKA